MNNKFYAIANTDKGQSVLISFNDMSKQPDYLYQAKNAAEAHCRKNNLQLQGVYMNNAVKSGGSTMTKFKKYRDKNNGRQDVNFSKAL